MIGPFTDAIDLLAFGAGLMLPLVVSASGVYEPGTQRRGMVVGSVGLFVVVAIVATTAAAVPGTVRGAAYGVVGLSLAYHLGMAAARQA